MIAPTVPVGRFVNDGATLFQWMGSFWTTLYQDPLFLRRLQAGRALMAAQAYLDVLEVTNILNRRLLPVLHRERWYPLVVRRSQRGQGEAAALKLGMEPGPVVGMQTDTAFPRRTTFRLGGDVAFANITTYPLNPVPTRILTCLVDNIAAPNVILVKDKDFTVQDGTLVLRTADDPFADGSVFPIDRLSTDGVEDQEAVLWACDVLFDKDYVYEHLGYVLGVKTGSTEYFKRLINSIWDLITSGATPQLLSSALGALCNVPTIQTALEQVQTITANPNGDILVITNASVYYLPPIAVMRDGVVPGALLRYGEFLDQAIKIYPIIADPTATKVNGMTEYSSTFRQDIPAITLPPTFFSTPLQYGFCLSWDAVPIYSAGLDANGNPKLWFPLQGLASDVTAFWQDVWNRCETQGISLETCFTGYLNDTVLSQIGVVCGHVEPLSFFLRNLLGANTLFVTLDSSQLRVGDRQQITATFVKLLRDTLPTYVRLFFVEHRTPSTSTYELEDSTSSENIVKYVSSDATSAGYMGGPSPARLTFKDRPPIVRWIAVCNKE